MLEKTEGGFLKRNKKILNLISSFAVGFFLAQFKAVEDISPFSCAFVSAVYPEYCFIAFSGSAMGYFFSQPWQNALRYLFALGFICAFRLFILKKIPEKQSTVAECVVAFGSCLCASVGYMALTEFSFYSVAMAFCEAGLAVLCVTAYKKAASVPLLSLGISNISTHDSVSLVFCVCAFFMCASGAVIGFVSPARILAAVIVIFVAHYKGVAASAVAGICAGLSFFLPQGESFLFAVYSLGALSAGIFSLLGQYTTAISFALCGSIVSIFASFNGHGISAVAEVIVAAGVYSMIPPSAILSFQEQLRKCGLVKDRDVERQVCANLNLAAGKVEEVSDIVMRVGERLDKIINPEINQVFSKMQQGLCSGCLRKSECWNRYFSETAFDIMVMSGIQKGNSHKTSLEKRCIRPLALADEVSKYYPEFVSAVATKVKIKEMRDLLSEQFLSVSLFLTETAKNASFNGVVDKPKSRSIKTALSDGGIYTDSIRYMTDLSGRITVQAVINESNAISDCEKMKSVIEFITARKFERPEIAVCDTRTEISFEEKSRYKIRYGSSQLPCAKNKICGDSIGYTKDLYSNEYAFLSDGMGTGTRAAIDAAMTCGLLEKLLGCGFSFESALRVVNSSLMMKSTDESLATADCLCINPFSGGAVFYKAGAAISFVRRGNSVSVVEEISMPIGIIKNISFAKSSLQLQTGDIVVLVSDGVTCGDCGWISDELLAWSTGNMNDLAAHISSLARLRADKNYEDDITVLCIRLTENNDS